MSAKQRINLLPKDEFESSTLGKFVKWAVSVGRWIVVFTEFIVICAFLSRFYFDTQLANLFDDLEQKQAMVKSATSFEQNFREVQKRTQIVKTILAEEEKPSELFLDINRLTPLDIFLTEMSFTEKGLTMGGYALSENGLNVFLNNLSLLSKLSEVSLNNISLNNEISGINFNISATVGREK